MGPAEAYPQFWKQCVRNLLIGTALSIVPAGAFYLSLFPYTERQMIGLGVLGTLDILIFLPLDIFILQWTLREVAGGCRAGADRDERSEALAALLDAPRQVIRRVYGPHAIAASIGITLLVMAGNQWWALGIPMRTFPLYWLLNLTVVPIAHVIYEFAAMERTLQPLAKALVAEGGGAGLACAPRYTLWQRMGLFFPMFVLAPMTIILLRLYFHAQEHWANVINIWDVLWNLLTVAVASAVLFGFLMITLGKQLSQQTEDLVSTLDQIGRGDLGVRAEMYSTDEFGQLAGHINTMVAGLAERERLRDLFGAYMTDEVAAALLEKGAEKTEKRYVAILFLDVRGFTAFSNERPPEVVVGVLNKLLEQAVEAIAAQHGTVNKYLGDGLLAIFGAPIQLENPCAAAVSAALEISKRVRGLNHLFAATGVPAMRIGIGIHAGEVVVGSIGSAKHKLEYTVIGDAVNVASRIEQLNKNLGTELLVSDEVWGRCGDLQSVFGVALTEQVKGVDKPVKVYPIVAGDRAAAS
jgi:class 3 adenylate cyclase